MYDFRCGSKCEELTLSICRPVYPLKPDIARRGWHGRKVPIAVLAGIQNTADASSHLGRFICRKATEQTMLFMIIERFKDNDMLPIYKRVRDEGRMIPDGLKYVDSWVEPNFSRCFQLMESDDLRLLQEWVLKWRGSGTSFEIVPILTSKETREVVAPFLDKT